MAHQINVSSERMIPAPPERVHAILADYHEGRPRILPGNYLDYKVEEGGSGDGTVISYRLRAARRERPYTMEVAEPTPGSTLVERDRDSSLVTTWLLSPTASGTGTDLKVTTVWEGADGVGGFFERTFAPKGLRAIYDDMLDRLEKAAVEPAGG